MFFHWGLCLAECPLSALCTSPLHCMLMVLSLPPLHLSSPADRINHWTPGHQDQWDPPGVWSPDQDRQPARWHQWPPRHHHRHTHQHQPGPVPHHLLVRSGHQRCVAFIAEWGSVWRGRLDQRSAPGVIMWHPMGLGCLKDARCQMGCRVLWCRAAMDVMRRRRFVFDCIAIVGRSRCDLGFADWHLFTFLRMAEGQEQRDKSTSSKCWN